MIFGSIFLPPLIRYNDVDLSDCQLFMSTLLILCRIVSKNSYPINLLLQPNSVKSSCQIIMSVCQMFMLTCQILCRLVRFQIILISQFYFIKKEIMIFSLNQCYGIIMALRKCVLILIGTVSQVREMAYGSLVFIQMYIWIYIYLLDYAQCFQPSSVPLK